MWRCVDLFANERQNKIADLLQQQGAITTAELAEILAVSVETVRRDLLVMEKNDLLRRVHGGAVLPETMIHFQNLSQRTEKNSDKKQELTQTALQLVSENDVIGLDSGSTSVLFAEALSQKFNSLTVVTYSLDVFHILSNCKNFKVILCAGHFLQKENAFHVFLALETLQKLHMEKVFLCPTAISLRYGLCDYVDELYPLQKQLIRCGSEVYVLADSSKFEKRTLIKLDDMNPRYTYLTDPTLPAELKKLYAENGLRVITRPDDI